jgi:CRP-like cAMP-binding protein
MYYIVAEGFGRDVDEGQDLVTIPEGKPFGILSLIDKKPRGNTACAREDRELALIDERTFRVMIEETPGFVGYMIYEFAVRLRATSALL